MTQQPRKSIVFIASLLVVVFLATTNFHFSEHVTEHEECSVCTLNNHTLSGTFLAPFSLSVPLISCEKVSASNLVIHFLNLPLTCRIRAGPLLL